MSDQSEVKKPLKLPKSLKGVDPILTISIMGEDYSVYLHTKSELNKLVSDCEAFMRFSSKEIRFNEECHTLATILHELIHCYIAGTYIHELVDLDKDSFEEVVCEVVSNNYMKMYDLAKMVEKAIKEEIKIRSQK